jgi:ABC-type phosphate transport system auxiliary subunit
MKNKCIIIGCIVFLASCQSENSVVKTSTSSTTKLESDCDELRNKIDEKNLEIESLQKEINKLKGGDIVVVKEIIEPKLIKKDSEKKPQFKAKLEEKNPKPKLDQKTAIEKVEKMRKMKERPVDAKMEVEKKDKMYVE